MTQEEIATAIKNIIPQYKCAAKKLASGKIFTRTAPQSYGYRDLNANCGAAYIWEDDKLVTICHNVRVYRLHKIVKAYNDYTNGIIPQFVWENYKTNGYNTRRGLYADYSNQKERMYRIAKSHADYMGCETGNSSFDHGMRVSMRSN